MALGSRKQTAAGLAGVVVVTGIVAASLSSSAVAYTSKVEDYCRADYFKFCSAYSVGSSALKNCMESNARNISQRCVDAMLKEGIIDRRKIRR